MSFEELLKRLSPKLKAIVYRLKGRFGFFDADDLYQEAIMHLWRDFNAHLLQDKTDSFILQGCYFYLKNYIRTHKKKVNLLSLQPQKDAGQEPDALEFLIPSDFQKGRYLDQLHSKFLVEIIQANGLSPREKDVLCFHMQGLTTREIGRRLGISHVYVVKITRAVREKCLRYLDNP